MPIVFRDFGTTNPWSLEFSLDHGPATIGFDSGFNATVVSDFGVLEEFRGYALRDFSGPEEFGITLLRNFIVTEEFRSSSLRDFSGPEESGSALLRDSGAPEESGSSSLLDFGGLEEFQSSLLSDFIVSQEIDLSVSTVDRVVALEFRSPLFSDFGTALSFNVTVVSGAIVPVDSLSALLRGAASNMGISATGQIDNLVPVVWTTTSFNETPVATSWGAQNVVDVASPLGFGTSRLRDDASILDPGLIVIGSEIIPAEWSGRLEIFEDVSSGIEFQTGRVASITASASWTAISQIDIRAEVGWTILLTPIEYAIPLSWDSSVVAENKTPADWSAPAIVDIAVSLEYSGIVAMIIDDAAAPLEFRSATSIDADVCADWSLSLAIRHTKGATLEVPNTSERKPVAEGSGTKGATLER